MNSKIYVNNERFILGMTLKDDNEVESNNMALHTCQNSNSVLSNRKKLAISLNTDIENFVCANQTHSDHFQKVVASDKGRGSISSENAIMDTDALYTYEPNILLSTFTADCVPVIFYNEKNGLIGVIHSGWQGTVKEISSKLFQHLTQNEDCDPKDFHIYLGAALSQDNFEVDEDVYTKFKNLDYADEFIYFKKETNKYHIDNQKTVKKQFELAGIPSNQIIIDKTCTYSIPVGFSYRQDKKCGRHLSFIMRKE